MPSFFKSLWVGAALLFLLTVVTYIPAFSNGFIWDDDLLITDNPLVKAHDGLYRFWFTTEAPDYYPLTSTAWWLEWRLWGNRAAGYHAVNVLLHAANVVLVWMVLRRLKVAGAWLAALLFGVHPVNVATVAWVSEQKNTLSMLFGALSVLCYLRFDEEGKGPWYGLALAAFLLALLSKAAVVMLPVALLGCVWWLRGRLRSRDWWRVAPFGALSGLLGATTIWFQYHRVLNGYTVRAEGCLSRLAAAGAAPWFYLCKAVAPFGLCMVYPKWDAGGSGWMGLLPGVALAGCFAVFWWKRDGWGRPALFGLGYYVVMLVPVLGFFDQGFYQYSMVADHWQYYSMVGPMALAVAGVMAAGDRLRSGRREILGGTAVVAAAGLAALSWQRCLVYQNQETLFRDNLAHNPLAWVAHNNLGLELIRQGREQEGVVSFQQALQLKPDYVDALRNMGAAMVREGKLAEALPFLRQAVRLQPDDASTQSSWGSVLLQTGHTEEALGHLREAVRLDPGLAQAHNNLGFALLKTGRSEEAVGEIKEALRLKPDFAEAHYNLGNALHRTGRTEEAIDEYVQAVQLKPDYVEAYNNLGATLLQAGRIDDGIKCLEQAVRLAPDQPDTHNNLGVALARNGNIDDAIAHFQEALRLRPGFPDAQRNLDRALQHQSTGNDTH